LIHFFPHLLCETLRASLCVTPRELLYSSGFHANIFTQSPRSTRKRKEKAGFWREHSTLIQFFPHLLCETLRASLCVTPRELLYSSGFHANISTKHAQRKRKEKTNINKMFA
jgi:7-keto-8-aminopelargonate synthetase-like enzyme